MTRTQAKAYYASGAEPKTYTEAAELFRAVFDRAPDDDDGDAGMLWSHVCAALGGRK